MPDQHITQSKQEQLAARMKKLGILDADLTEKFILGSGKGGQKVNKTSSCVYLRHEPSGIDVKCQKERSRAINRFFARRALCDRFEERILGEASERKRKAEKIRRQKRRRSRRQKEKMLAEKHKQGLKKDLRRPVSQDHGSE